MGGFIEHQSHLGLQYDSNSDDIPDLVTQLDFAVDGRLNIDYENATKSGIEYGAHFELDFYQSDGGSDICSSS